MIRPIKLYCQNYFLFKDFAFSFPQEFEIFHLIGEHGKGKSTVLDIIPYLLFGKFIKNGITKSDATNQHATSHLVGGIFDINGIEYTIERSSHGIKLFKGSEPVAYTNTQKFIDELVGMDFEMFQNSYYYGQETKPFRELSNKDKELFFNILFQDDKLDVLEEAAKNEVDRLSLEIKLKEKQTQILESVITNSNNEIQKTLKTIDSEKGILESIEFSENKLLILEKSEIVSKEVEKINAEIKTKIITKEFEVKELEKRIDNANSILEKFESFEFYDLQSLDSKLESITTQIHSLNEIAKGFKCNRCDKVFGSERVLTAEEIKHLESLKITKEKLESEKQFIKTYESVQKINLGIDILKAKKDAFNFEITTWQKQIESNEISILSEEENKQLKNLKAAKSDFEKYTHSIKMLIDNLEQSEIYLNDCIVEKDTLEHEISVLSEELEMASIWKKGFSDKGLKRYKIESICNIINERIKEICEVINLNINIELVVSTSKANKGFTILHNKRNCAASSGAEKNVIDLVLFLVFNSITEQKFSFIILDEVFKNCNQKTTEKLFNILNKIDYITTFIISHRNLSAENVFELKDQKITKL
jgi:DNA repair exonuclease SbcCD ATPase subunit